MFRRCHYRAFLIGCLILDMVFLGLFWYRYLKEAIPDTVYLTKNSGEGIEEIIDYPFVTCQDSIEISGNGTYFIKCNLFDTIFLKEVQVKMVEERDIFVCGMPVGLYMETRGVLIVDTGEITGSDGMVREPAKNIAKSGDYILKVNNEEISSKRELILKINECQGTAVELLVLRGNEEIPVRIEPVRDQEGKYKLGIWVRDNTQGIGTLTYVETDGNYGALGHGISDTDTGKLLKVEEGELYRAEIIAVQKGAKGTPGELSGYIDYVENKKIGSIEENTQKGIFGAIYKECRDRLPLEPVCVGYKQEVKKGEAEILVQLDGKVQAYKIEITDIYPDKADTNKAFAIQVTDAKLLSKTGGIVQGMSGSPIVQDGKLIGAVTHVFVQDSTKGYGIFIEKMLE